MSDSETGGTFATNQKVEPVKITVKGKGFNKSLWFYGANAFQVWEKITEQFNYTETEQPTNGRRTTRTRKTQEEREVVAA